jgi:hypothetical protein
MLTKNSWNEASYAFGGGPGALLAAARGAAASRKAFDTTHGGREMTKAEIAAQFQTTARDAAEGGIAISSQAMAVAAQSSAALARSIHAMPAGGVPSVGLDKGKRITGVSGEIVRESADARYDSRAQRAWTGVPDVGLLHGMGKEVRPRRWRAARASTHKKDALSHISARTPNPQRAAPRPEVTWMSPALPSVIGAPTRPPAAKRPMPGCRVFTDDA